MSIIPQLYITGIPDSVSEAEAATFRSKILTYVQNFIIKLKISEIDITVSTSKEISIFKANNSSSKAVKENNNQDITGDSDIYSQSAQYPVQKPIYFFDHIILSEDIKENLLSTVNSIQVEEIVFDAWGLRKIQPYPRSILNFYGPPGTGKTLAAHAIADYLKKPILLASYADIESKFHGEGPKNLQAIFRVAEENNALLFLDESDSLLSKRLTNIDSGSEQAINSMRSQLLICLEQFRGIVIFATNLIENYDKAFETRVKHIPFELPGFKEREEIWKRHIPEELPVQPDINTAQLAQIDEICGRDIREAVIDAANRAALRAKNQGEHPSEGKVSMDDLEKAILRRKDEQLKVRNNSLDREKIKSAIKDNIDIIDKNV